MTLSVKRLTREEEESHVVHVAISAGGQRIGMWWPGLPLPPTIFFGSKPGMTRHGYRWNAMARWDREGNIANWTIEDEVPVRFGGSRTSRTARKGELGVAIVKILARSQGLEASDGAAAAIEDAVGELVAAYRDDDRRASTVFQALRDWCSIVATARDDGIEDQVVQTYSGSWALRVVERTPAGGEYGAVIAAKALEHEEAMRLASSWRMRGSGAPAGAEHPADRDGNLE